MPAYTKIRRRGHRRHLGDAPTSILPADSKVTELSYPFSNYLYLFEYFAFSGSAAQCRQVGCLAPGTSRTLGGCFHIDSARRFEGMSTFLYILRFFDICFEYLVHFFTMKARQNSQQNPRPNAREQGGHLPKAPSAHSRTSLT